jgi:hypothetical protein
MNVAYRAMLDPTKRSLIQDRAFKVFSEKEIGFYIFIQTMAIKFRDMTAADVFPLFKQIYKKFLGGSDKFILGSVTLKKWTTAL